VVLVLAVLGGVLALAGFATAAFLVPHGAVDRRGVARELAPVAALGAVVGIGIGILMARELVDAFATPLVELESTLDASTVVITLVAVSVAFALAVLVATRTRLSSDGTGQDSEAIGTTEGASDGAS
jgi:hypothetical protein